VVVAIVVGHFAIGGCRCWRVPTAIGLIWAAGLLAIARSELDLLRCSPS
jgi:hypothetical protein